MSITVSAPAARNGRADAGAPNGKAHNAIRCLPTELHARRGGHSAAGAHTNRRLVELIVARERDRAEAHRRRHMENAGIALLRGYDKLKVREIMS